MMDCNWLPMFPRHQHQDRSLSAISVYNMTTFCFYLIKMFKLTLSCLIEPLWRYWFLKALFTPCAVRIMHWRKCQDLNNKKDNFISCNHELSTDFFGMNNPWNHSDMDKSYKRHKRYIVFSLLLILINALLYFFNYLYVIYYNI